MLSHLKGVDLRSQIQHRERAGWGAVAPHQRYKTNSRYSSDNSSSTWIKSKIKTTHLVARSIHMEILWVEAVSHRSETTTLLILSIEVTLRASQSGRRRKEVLWETELIIQETLGFHTSQGAIQLLTGLWWHLVIKWDRNRWVHLKNNRRVYTPSDISL